VLLLSIAAASAADAYVQHMYNIVVVRNGTVFFISCIVRELRMMASKKTRWSEMRKNHHHFKEFYSQK
jgi:hypothetical protein